MGARAAGAGEESVEGMRKGSVGGPAATKETRDGLAQASSAGRSKAAVDGSSVDYGREKLAWAWTERRQRAARTEAWAWAWDGMRWGWGVSR